MTACESEEDDYVTPAQKNRREGRSVLPTGQSPHHRRNEYKADRVEDVYFEREGAITLHRSGFARRALSGS